MRERLRGERRSDLLSRDRASDSTVVSGVLYVPVLPVLYANTDSAGLVQTVPRNVLETRLFSTAPAQGRGSERSYSIHTYYDEQSNGVFNIVGSVFDWRRVPKPDTTYEGPAGCQGGFGLTCGNVPLLIQHIVDAWDTDVDFGAFDNDGPDGVPNSGDDDGYVDVLVLLHPKVDGACKFVSDAYANNIRAYRSRLDGWKSVPTKDSSRSRGSKVIKVADYIIQGAQGGDGGCTPYEPQAINVLAHELGHMFGLPDLYDTQFAEGHEHAFHFRGIGNWGLLGTASQIPKRPAHMSAWEKAQLGWIDEVIIERDTVLDIGPIESADTAYVIPIDGTNEYFFLSNRQLIGSDVSLSETSPSPFGGTLGPGLLIFHVDSMLVRQRRDSNEINAGSHGGVTLEQADGQYDLEAARNNGDAGDPFPGSTRTMIFSHRARHAHAAPVEIIIDRIKQQKNGRIHARLHFAATDADQDLPQRRPR